MVKTMLNKTFFGTELLIIQTPMVGVQDSALKIAVSNAGGLGSRLCTMHRADEIRAKLKFIKSQISKPFNLNFFCQTAPELDLEREAKWSEANGTDAIIAQRLEAGGLQSIFLNNDLLTQVATFEQLK